MIRIQARVVLGCIVLGLGFAGPESNARGQDTPPADTPPPPADTPPPPADTPPADTAPPALGSLRGKIVDAADGQPVIGATVTCQRSTASAITEADGTFVLDGVAAGTEEVTVMMPGYEARVLRLTVQPGQAAPLDVALVRGGSEGEVIDIVVFTGSRAPEKLLDSPVTIESISADDLKARGGTISTALAQVKGVDFATSGVNEQRISARGFNTQFNSRMLSMLDGHATQLPGSGLPMGNLLPTTPLDMKSVELVIGPASALYGPNAHTGVVNVITKTPWDESGLSASLRGGTQDLIDGAVRAAGTFQDRFGWKVNGEYLRATDFEPDRAAPTHFYGTTVFEGDLVEDYGISALKLDGSAYAQLDTWKARASYGFSISDGFSATNAGRNHLRGWQVHTQNLQAGNEHWFAQVTRTATDSGDTYPLNSLASAVAAMGGAPDDPATLEPLKEQLRFVDHSQSWDGEVQYNHTLFGVRGVTGLQLRAYLPASDGTYLDDKEDSIHATEVGGYLQLERAVLPERLNLVGAARVDHHSDYSTQLSPKLFAVVSLAPEHKLRFGYNRAYKSPTILENYLSINTVLLGNRTGFVIKDAAGTELSRIDPLDPERVNSLEAGYKGVIGQRLFIDVVAYNAWYENFISPLSQVANPAAAMPTFGFYPDGTPVAEGTPAQGMLFTYVNFGKAMVRGADLGLTLQAMKGVSVTASGSLIDLASFDSGGTALADLLLNVPEVKLKGAVTVKDLGFRNYFVSVAGRFSNAYAFRSGFWDSAVLLPGGDIPARFVLDASAGYTFDSGLSVLANVSNALDDASVDVLGGGTPRRMAYLQLGYAFDGLKF